MRGWGKARKAPVVVACLQGIKASGETSRSGASRAGLHRTRRALRLALLAGTCLAPFGAQAQSDTWKTTPTNNSYNNAANWVGGNIPADQTSTATFDTSTASTVVVTYPGDLKVASFKFNASPTEYAFVVTGGTQLRFLGAGIVNNSSNVPSFAVDGSANGLWFEDASKAGNARIFVTNGGLLVFNSTSNAENATINLSGASTKLDVSGGTLGVVAGSTLGNATLTISGSDFVTIGIRQNASGGSAKVIADGAGSLSIMNLEGAGTTLGSLQGSANIFQVALGSKQLTVGSNDLSTTFAGRLTGTGGSIVKVGIGTWTLTSTSTYTGGTTINAGAISISRDGNLGAASGALAFGGGTLQVTADVAMSRATTLNAGGGTFDVATGKLFEHGGDIDGTGGLTKTGNGTLSLKGTNSYAGGTTINGGTVRIEADANLGGAAGGLTFGGGTLQLQASNFVTMSRSTILNAGGGTFDIAADATLTHSGIIDGGGSLTKTGGGVLTLAGANTYSGGTVVNGGTVSISSDSNLGLATGILALNNGTLSVTDDISMSRATTLGGSVDTFDVVAGKTLTQSGVVSGGGTLLKQGNGTLVLAGANNYTGGTIIKGGTLSVSTDSNLGAAGTGVSIDGGTIRFTSAQTFSRTFTLGAGGGTFEANGVAPNISSVTGTGGLTKIGTGLLVIVASADYVGPTHVKAGGMAGRLSSASAYTMDGGTFLMINGDRTIKSLAGAGTVARGGPGVATLTFGSDNTSTTFSGNFNDDINTPAGPLALTKVGSGTMILAGGGTYSGGVTINDGVLSISGNANLGAAGGTLAFGGGVLRTTADITMSRATTLNLTGFFDVATGTTLTQNGVIGGAYGLTKSGGGTLVLGAANTYGGQTTIEGGTLALSGAGSIASSIVSLTIAGATFDISAASGNRTIGDLSGAVGTKVVLGSHTLTVGAGNATTFDGVITDVVGGSSLGGSLIKAGGNRLTLTKIQDYTGATTVTGGTLALTGAGNLFASSGVTVASGATFDVSGGGSSYNPIRSLAGAGTVRLGSNGLSVMSASGEFSGVINGTSDASLELRSGTLTLSGVSTYGGVTQIHQGATLALKGAGSIASTSYVSFLPNTSGRATFDISQTTDGATVGGLRDSSGDGAVVLGDRTLTLAGGSGTGRFNGVVSGNGGLTLADGASQELGGANTYGGTTAIGAGAVLRLMDSGSIASSREVALTGAGATFDISGADGDRTIKGLSGVAGASVVLGSRGLTVDAANNTSFAGVIDGGGSLIKTGNGTLTLSGTNTYGGGTTINGGVLAVSSNDNLGNANGGLIFGGGTLRTTADITMSRTTTLNTEGGTFDVAASKTLTQNGVVSGDGALTKTGSGTLVLGGANTYRGGTKINGGVLAVSSDGNLGNVNGGLSFDGGTLKLGASFDLARTRAISLQAGGGTIDTNGFNMTIARAISGAGGLTKIGDGTLILTDDNSYTGITAINGGILQLGNGGTTGMIAGDVALSNNAILAFSRSDNVTFSGDISGSGSVAYMGPGTVTLTGASTYTGGTAITGGTVQAGSDSAFGTAGGLTLVNGTLQATATFTIARAITLDAPGGTFDTNGNTLTLQGVISGGGSLTQQGSGTLTLAGANTYTGATTIAGGTLALSASGSVAMSSGVTLTTAGATFDVSAGSASQTIQDLSGVAGTFVVLGDNALAVGTANSTTFSGTISGGGGLTKQGSGTLTLTGPNGYTGATTITAGTLALSGAGSVAASSGVSLAGAGATFDISGASGGIILQTLSGIAGTSVVLGGNGLAVGTGSDTSFAGNISGTGGLTKQGSGTLTLSGENDFTGVTTINAGTLALSGAGSIAASSGVSLASTGVSFDISASNGPQTIQGLSGVAGSKVVLGNQVLTVGTANSTTFSGTIEGNGGLTKVGSGTLTFDNANGYAGATTINAGTLALIGSGRISYSSVTVASGATFDISGSDYSENLIQSLAGAGTVKLGSVELVVDNAAGTFSGSIVDAGAGNPRGALTILSGTQTLSGASTYGGVTKIYQGATLVLTGAGSIANTLYVAFAPSSGGGVATFDISGTTGGATVGGLFGTSGSDLSVVLGNQTLTITGTQGGFTGIISGSGGLVLAANAAQGLAGLNTYTGATTIGAGATLTIYDNGSIAASSGVTLAGAGASFDISGASGGSTIQDLSGVVGSTLLLGSKSLTVGTANSTSFAGVIADGGMNGGYGGSLIKQGSGTLILTGTNTYTGGTTVSGGVLQGTTSSLQGNITNNAAVTFDQNNDGTYFGTMSGTGNLTKTGMGNVTLAGPNTYTGGTTVSGGTLTGTTTSLQGNIVNEASVVFDQAVDGTYAGVMSGSGVLTKTGGGTLVLTADNTFTGGTIIAGGTLQLGNGGTTGMITGDVFNDGILAFNRSDNITFAGDISGSGSIAYMGPGTVTLTGSSTYSGGTAIAGGTVQAGSDSAFGEAGTRLTLLNGTLQATASFTIARPITLSGRGGTFDTNGHQLTLQGALSGSGGLTKTGAGTLILDGTNTYRGGTTVMAGVLQGTTASLQRNIVNNAMVVFDQDVDGTYAGNLTGSGSLTKSGAGLLNLTGTNAVGGGTTVSGGVLAVNGSLTSNVTVTNGGALGGSGQLIGALAVNGGTLAPGNSIGTLNVTGNFSQTGGVYQVEANAQSQSDKIVASGTATIGGGAMVQVLAAQGTYQRNTTYTILTATGGLTGTYSGVSSNLAFLTPSLSYDANNVYLLLAQTASAFAAGAQTANQYAVGTALDIASPTATGDFSTVLNALAGLSTQQGPAALNTISGQPYSGFGSMNLLANQLFMNTLGQQIALARTGGPGAIRVALAEVCQVACDSQEPPRWGAWFSGLGGAGGLGGNANAGSLTYNFGGAAVGVDYRLDPRFLVGLAFGYSSGRQWVSGFQGTGYTDTYSAALYASFSQGGFYADALAGYAYGDNRLQRVMQIPGLATRYANGGVGANQFLGQIEAGYKIGFGLSETAQASITPFARFQTVAASQKGFSEWGAQSLNLQVQQQNTTSVRTVLGVDLAAGLPLGSERSLGVTLRLGWAHDYADTTRPMTASFAGAPAVPFTVYGAQPMRDSAVIGLGLSTQIATSTQLYLRYDGELNGRDDNHTFSAGLRMTW